MGTLKQLKKEMRADKELCAMMVRSTRHELHIDLDGDKIADIALLDDNRDGDIDTIAIDLTGDGEFNFYAGDRDGNGIIDSIEIYDDVDDMPIAAYFGRAVEERFMELAEAVYAHIVAGELISNELLRTFVEFELAAEQEYAAARQEKAAAPAEEAAVEAAPAEE